MLPFMESVAALLRAGRLSKNMTQDELALRSGISTHHVRQLESSKRADPRWSTIVRLAAVLGLDLNDLARQTIEPAPLSDRERALLETLQDRDARAHTTGGTQR